MIFIGNTTGCCTAKQFHNFGCIEGWDNKSKEVKILVLTNLLGEIEGHNTVPNFNDCKVLWGVTVAEQYGVGDFFKELGWTKGYECDPDKWDEDKIREVESGPLSFWFVPPAVFDENVKALLKKLQGSIEDRKKEREGFPEFRLIDFQKSDVFQKYHPNERLFRATEFPARYGDEKALTLNFIRDTYGFGLRSDPIFIGWIRPTWGQVKDRLVSWRNGEF